jgi:hypothetical protein
MPRVQKRESRNAARAVERATKRQCKVDGRQTEALLAKDRDWSAHIFDPNLKCAWALRLQRDLTPVVAVPPPRPGQVRWRGTESTRNGETNARALPPTLMEKELGSCWSTANLHARADPEGLAICCYYLKVKPPILNVRSRYVET